MTETFVQITYDDRGGHDNRGSGGRVATVTINRPEKLNALNRAVLDALIAAWATLRLDDALRVVILRGAGERAFVGGADIRELGALNPVAAEAFITAVHHACDGARRLPVPVIARIRGHVLGAGLELAAACDMRVSDTSGVFGMPEVKIGLPSVVEAAILPQLIGWGRTRQLLLTGENIDARKAERWGLIEELVEPDDLDAAVERLVNPILASGPRAVRQQKALISDWEDLSLRGAIKKGIDYLADAYRTDEPTRMVAHTIAALDARKKR